MFTLSDEKKYTDYLNKIEEKHHERHAAVLLQFGQLGKHLVELKDIIAKQLQQKRETIGLQYFEQTYDSQGYTYNSIFVSDTAVTDGAKLKVNYDGITWTVTLAAGENKLDLPDGAKFTAETTGGSTIYSAVLLRYNRK